MMDLQKAPRLAVLLLKWFGLAHDEALAGDLIEEYRSGRTAGWFWRQTLGAIGAAVGGTVRKPEVRSLIVAYGIVTAAAACFLQLHGPVVASLRSLLITVLVIAALKALRRRFKVEKYGGGFLVKQWIGVIWGTGVMVLVAGNIGSPLLIIGTNGLCLLGDLWQAIRRSTLAARSC